jgi:arsenite methyltransferase
VLRAWDQHLAHRSLPRRLAARLRAAGFEDVGMSAHAFATTEFDDDSYGGALIPFIAAFVQGREGVTEDDAHGWVAGQRELDAWGEFYFAITQFCFTARKPQYPVTGL